MNDAIAKKYWNQEFGDEAEFLNPYFATFVDEKGVVLTKEAGVLVGMAVIARYEYMFCSQKLSMAYLTGFMTLPAWRHLGYMHKTMKQALRSAKLQNYDVCVLIPATEELSKVYEHFGFTSVFTTQKPITYEKTVLHSDKDILLHQRLGYNLSKPYTHGNGMIRLLNPKRVMSYYAKSHKEINETFTIKDDLIMDNNITYTVSNGLTRKSHEDISPIGVKDLSARLFKDSYMDCMFDE